MAPTGNGGEWRRVAQHVRSRREELDLVQREAADAAGVSDTTWSHIESGDQNGYSPRTLRGVCRALGWTPESIDRILAGGEPEVTSTPTGHGGTEGWPVYMEQKYDEAIALARLALTSVEELREEVRRLAGEDGQ